MAKDVPVLPLAALELYSFTSPVSWTKNVSSNRQGDVFAPEIEHVKMFDFGEMAVFFVPGTGTNEDLKSTHFDIGDLGEDIGRVGGTRGLLTVEA